MSSIELVGNAMEWIQSLPLPGELAVGGPVDREFALKFGELDASPLRMTLSHSCNAALVSSKFAAELRELDTPEMRAAGGRAPPCSIDPAFSTSGSAIKSCACRPARLVHSISTSRFGVVYAVYDSQDEMMWYMRLAMPQCGSITCCIAQIYKALLLRTFTFVRVVTRQLKGQNDDGTVMWQVLRTLDRTRMAVIPDRFEEIIIAEIMKI